MYEQQYPYVHAWGINFGSLPYYRDGEAEVAQEDGVPADVIYRRDFTQITQRERDDALLRERDGTTVVVRNGGEPFRVWYRVGIIAGKETRERVTAMAERLKVGEPPRG